MGKYVPKTRKCPTDLGVCKLCVGGGGGGGGGVASNAKMQT